MILDLNKRQLYYKQNGKDCGIAYKNVENCGYIACISVFHENDGIELISYQTNQDQDEIKCNECSQLHGEIKILQKKRMDDKQIHDTLNEELRRKITKIEQDNIELQAKFDIVVFNLKQQIEGLMKEKHDDKVRYNLEYERLRDENQKLQEQIDVSVKAVKGKFDGVKIGNAECKECEELVKRLQDVTDKYEGLLSKVRVNESEYEGWDSDMITDWIINLDVDYQGYEDILRKTLKEEEVEGVLLPELDRNDLHRFGIKVLKHKISIMKHIKRLQMY